MPCCFALDHVSYMSNFELAQLVPWGICCMENIGKGVATVVDYCPKLTNLAKNGRAVLANKCTEEDANASRQLAVHRPVHMQ